VSGILAGLGCEVIDADTLAKRLLDEPDVQARLVERWGDAVLTAEGLIDRRAVAERVFADEAELTFLEARVHPPVVAATRRAVAAARAAGRPGVVIDAPKLIEAGLDADCDVILFVEVPYDVRRARVAKTRGWEEDELDRRENRQMPLDKKRQLAHYVVQNEGDFADLRSRVEALFQHIRERMISQTRR
jgi:dephospho-CoA kinase